MRDLDMDNSYNRDWNSRTLTLMSRAGVLTLDDAAPMTQEADALPLATRVVRIEDDRHLDAEFWQERIEPQRAATEGAQKSGWKKMRQLLAGERCAAEILAEAYSLPAGVVGPQAVTVARSCGGCPACRRAKNTPFSHDATPSRFPWEPLQTLGSSARALFGGGNLLVVFYEDAPAKTLLPRFSKLLGWSINQGVRGWVAPPQWEGDLAQSQSKLLASRGVFTLSPAELNVSVPTILFQAPGGDGDAWRSWKRRLEAPEKYAPLLLVLPAQTPDPARRDRLWSEMATFPCLRLQEWEARFGG